MAARPEQKQDKVALVSQQVESVKQDVHAAIGTCNCQICSSAIYKWEQDRSVLI